jgi:glyoxylase I family protein
VKARAFFLCVIVIVIVIGGCMNQKAKQSSEKSDQQTANSQSIVKGLWGVRYQVKDVKRALNFYSQQLGFKVDMQNPPAFAQVSINNLKLILSGPGASGSRKMPDGREQEPGGWNRVILEVDDLAARIETLKKAGLHFRNEMEVGPGGKQIQLEDPDGNPIELFEPAH